MFNHISGEGWADTHRGLGHSCGCHDMTAPTSGLSWELPRLCPPLPPLLLSWPLGLASVTHPDIPVSPLRGECLSPCERTEVFRGKNLLNNIYIPVGQAVREEADGKRIRFNLGWGRAPWGAWSMSKVSQPEHGWDR